MKCFNCVILHYILLTSDKKRKKCTWTWFYKLWKKTLYSKIHIVGRSYYCVNLPGIWSKFRLSLYSRLQLQDEGLSAPRNPANLSRSVRLLESAGQWRWLTRCPLLSLPNGGEFSHLHLVSQYSIPATKIQGGGNVFSDTVKILAGGWKNLMLPVA